MGKARNVLMVLLTAVSLLVMLLWDLNLPPGVIHGLCRAHLGQLLAALAACA